MIRVKFVTHAWPTISFMASGFFKELKSKYNAILVTENADICFYENCKVKENDNSKLKVFVTGENSVPSSHAAFDLVIGFKSRMPNEYHLPLWTFYMNWDPTAVDDPLCIVHFLGQRKQPTSLADKHFCGFVSNIERPYRVSFVKLLSQTYKQVTCGGEVMNNIGGKIGKYGKDKQEFLRLCKFGIAFENESTNTDMIGYTTEKIFETFAAGIVPIYWGDPTVSTIFNPKAFLNRHEFASDEEFIREIAAVDQDDQRYLAMLSEPIFLNDRIPDSFYPNSICMKIAELYHNKRK